MIWRHSQKLSYIATVLEGIQRSQKLHSHSLKFSAQNHPRPLATDGLKVGMWSTPGSLQPVAIVPYWEILKARVLKVRGYVSSHIILKKP